MKRKFLFLTSTICICSFFTNANAEIVTSRINLTGGQSATYDSANIVGQDAPTGIGGAIYNAGGTLIIGDNAVLENNYSSTMGSALYNGAAGSISIGNNALFRRNNASSYGGIMNTGNSMLYIGDNARFLDNYTTIADSVGAALFNQEATATVGDGALFQNNTTKTSGAAVYQQVRSGNLDSILTIGDNARFLANSAASGAAIYNFNNGNLDSKVVIGKNAEFNGNHALTARGGAIGNWFGTFTLDDGALFQNNKSGTAGGAIISEGYFTFLGRSLFRNNTTNDYGGAIANVKDYGSTDTYLNFDDDAMFSDNHAGTYGGAISNDAEMVFATTATFTNNSAGTYGGAIANTGVLNFLGNVNFYNNTANGVLNDIANSGTISFADNTTVFFDGGISNIGSGGAIIFGDNINLGVKLLSTPTINADTINIGSNVSISNLIIASDVVGENIALTNGTLNGDFIFDQNNYTNLLFNVSYQGSGLFNVIKKSDTEIAQETGTNINDVRRALAILNGTSGNEKFSAIQNAIEAMMQTGGTNSFDSGIVAANALAPTKAPVAKSNSTQNAQQVLSAVGNRLSNDSVSTNSGTFGMSSGDTVVENVTLWASGLHNMSTLHGDNSFDSKSWGIAAGLEIGDRPLKAGLGYAFTSTDVDFDDRDIDISSNTAILYFQYKPTDTYVNMIGSYTVGDFKEQKQVAGIGVEGNNNVYSIAVQGMLGHDLILQNRRMTNILSPEIGLRYINIDNREYTDSAGTRIAGNKSDILTGITKLNFGFIQSENKFVTVRPKFSVALTYDLVTDDAVSVVTLGNGNVYSVSGEALSRFGGEVEVGMGLAWKNGLDLAIAYQGRFRDHYTDHSGIINLRYKF